jgi:hypothetical protein
MKNKKVCPPAKLKRMFLSLTEEVSLSSLHIKLQKQYKLPESD